MISSYTIYKLLPVVLQNVASSLEGLRVKKERYGGNFYKLLLDAEKRTTWSNEEIVSYRNNRLKQYLKHCQENIPFYREYFRDNDLDYRDIHSLEDLTSLPIITKREINENLALFTNNKLSRRNVVKMYTSGSTGSPLHFYTTKEALRELWSIFWRYRRWHGINLDSWGAYLLGRPIVPIENENPPYWRINLPGRQLLMSGFHLNKANSIWYLKELKKRKISWIYGYPSLIALLAHYKIEEDFELGYKMECITTNSENLLPEQINKIKKAFGIKPVQLYGMAEAVANISECPSGFLHVDEDYSAVEFIKIDNNVGYKIVGTNYSNYATAFVRYEINDIFQLDDAKCDCGRPGRIVKSIDGRKEDYIFLKNGRRVGRMSLTFKNTSNIMEAQILQKNINDIVVRIVKGVNYSKRDENILLSALNDRTGGLLKIKFEYVDKIPRTPNGKLRLVVSELYDNIVN